MCEIQNIREWYNGVRFRSRLEAKWAVFWDALGVRYFYEYEGFELPSGRYVPDFWLPHLEIWVEIKPNEPTDNARSKARDLLSATDKPVLLYWDEVIDPLELGRSPRSTMFWYVKGLSEEEPEALCLYDEDWWAWQECVNCGQIGVGYSYNDGNKIRSCHCNCVLSEYSDRLKAAYRQAQNYSFW
ncbi:hypothetical protein HY772_10275 [Candidatus Woesearchaeota archaeon]|nr:hypothetical protein [Candidatus Woesearchaeota archaeon]